MFNTLVLAPNVVSGEIDVFPVGYRSMKFGEFLSLRGRGKETCRCVIAMTETTLAEIEGKLKELQKFRDALKAILVRWRQRSMIYCNRQSRFTRTLGDSAG